MKLSNDSYKLILEYLGKQYYNQVIINKAFVNNYDCRETLIKNITVNETILKYSINSGCKLNEYLSAQIGKYGNVKILTYAHKKLKCPWDETTYNTVIEHGNLPMLKYLHKNDIYHKKRSKRATYYAVKSGKLSIVKYLHELLYEWDSEVINMALKNENLDILKYLVKNGCKINLINTINTLI